MELEQIEQVIGKLSNQVNEANRMCRLANKANNIMISSKQELIRKLANCDKDTIITKELAEQIVEHTGVEL